MPPPRSEKPRTTRSHVASQPARRFSRGDGPAGRVRPGVLIAPDRQLALVLGRAHPRPADLDAPAAQRHRPTLTPVTLRGPVLIALSDLGHLALYQLMADAETEPGAQREQPSVAVRRARQRFLNLRRRRRLRRPHSRHDQPASGAHKRLSLLHSPATLRNGRAADADAAPESPTAECIPESC